MQFPITSLCILSEIVKQYIWYSIMSIFSLQHYLTRYDELNRFFIDFSTVIQVRHAQGYHNVAGDIDYNAYMCHDYVDAALTPLGWKQVIPILYLV